MNRRALLRTIGAAGTAGAFAGCVGSGGAPGASPTDSDDHTGTPDGTKPPAESETPGGDGAETSDDGIAQVGDHSTVAFPDANKPHLVTVKNTTADPATVGLSLSAEGRESVWERTVDVAPDEAFELRLNEPAHYTLEVRFDPDADADATTVDDTVSDPDATVDVPLSTFDCNQSGTQVKLTADGVDSTAYTTEMACSAPELAGIDLSLADGGCGNADADAATVRYDDEAVRVTGTVSMPDPCRGVKLSQAKYDDETATLSLTVAVQPPNPAGTCLSCLGVRDYEATASFEVDLPDRVVVRHADDHGTTHVVTRAVRGGESGE